MISIVLLENPHMLEHVGTKSHPSTHHGARCGRASALSVPAGRLALSSANHCDSACKAGKGPSANLAGTCTSTVCILCIYIHIHTKKKVSQKSGQTHNERAQLLPASGKAHMHCIDASKCLHFIHLILLHIYFVDLSHMHL